LISINLIVSESYSLDMFLRHRTRHHANPGQTTVHLKQEARYALHRVLAAEKATNDDTALTDRTSSEVQSDEADGGQRGR
jgi:hypothetical protein